MNLLENILKCLREAPLNLRSLNDAPPGDRI